jgi:hypothetical protein
LKFMVKLKENIRFPDLLVDFDLVERGGFNPGHISQFSAPSVRNKTKPVKPPLQNQLLYGKMA